MGFIVKAVKSVVKTVVGVASKVVGTIIGPVVGLFKPKKAAKSSSNLRLSKDLTPEAYRKIVFGLTAGGLDVRYWQVYGPKGTLYDEVIAVAGHQINSFKELYFENELAINAAGVPVGTWAGVVSRQTKLGAPGQTGLNSGTLWTAANSPFTGVAHMNLKWIPTEAKLPNGIPSRYTQIIEGALVYDPRRDSSVGGSGTMRASDQTTWSYSTLDPYGQPIGRNNALQALWYLLGWYVTNPVTSERILVLGRGVDPSDINYASFINAANNCEVAGYYTDMILSSEDDHITNEEKITAGGLIGTLMDAGGLWSYYANVNDTANIAIELTDKDIIQGGSLTWNEFRPMSEQYQMVGGKFIDPSINSLFQLNGYPTVRDSNYEALSGLKRRKTQDFEVVQDVMLAQKLARLLLNMGQYQAEFAAPFMWRALKAQTWSIVRYTSERFGWVKLFRVYRHDITADAGVSMLLREIHPSIWDAGSVVQPVAPSAGVKYDPRQEIVLEQLSAVAVAITGTNGNVQDGLTISWGVPPANVRRTEAEFKQSGSIYWTAAATRQLGETSVNVGSLLPVTLYDVRARHISIHEIPGPWVSAIGPIVTADYSAFGGIKFADLVDGVVNAGSDNMLSSGEKSDAAINWQVLNKDYAAIEGRFIQLGSPADIQDERENAYNAIQTLGQYLGSLVPPWSDVNQDSPIDGPTYRTRWIDALDKLAQYRAVITGRKGDQGEVGSGSWTHKANSVTTIVTPNSARSTANAAWGVDASQSVEAYARGAAVNFDFPIAAGSNRHAMAGLTAHPSSTLAAERISFAIYRAPDGYMDIRIDGALYSSVVAPDPSKAVSCRVEFDGVDTVRWYISNVLKTTFFWAYPDTPLFFATAFTGTDAQINNIAFSAIGARGRNGTDGTPGAKGADGLTSYNHYAYANSPNGSIDFVKGAPNGRAFVGFYTDFTASDSNDFNRYAWAAYKGPAAFGLTARGDVTLASNSLVKVGTSTWGGGGGFSTEGWAGGAQTSFRLDADTIAGLNSDPANGDSYETIDYAWHCSSNGSTIIFESGVQVYTLPNGNDGSRTFQIVYDNETVTYSVNGQIVREIPVAQNLTLYFDAAIALAPGAKIMDITFTSAGAKGTKGTTGNDGIDGFVISASPSSFVIPCYSNGTNKPAWVGGSCSINFQKGGQNIAPNGGYSVPAQTAMATLALNGATVTFAGIIADKGEFTVRATHNGVTYDQRVTCVKTKDGEAAFKGSVNLDGSGSGATATGSTVVPASRNSIISAFANYNPTDSVVGSYAGSMSIYWRNQSDGGPWNLLGTVNGSAASVTNLGTTTEPNYQYQSGTVSASFGFVSPSTDKQIGFQCIVSRISGNSNVQITGSLKLEVSA